jgi:hypothetical protein
MAGQNELPELFGRAYNKVVELYDEDDQDKCIAAAQDLLEDPDLPRYHRIKTLILLGLAFEDWDDVETCRLAAERLWEPANRHYSRVDDPDASRALAELRDKLDTMAAMQIEELAEIFGNSEDEYEVDDDGEGDEEEYEKEGEREADMEIDVDDGVAAAGADTGADADAVAISSSASNAAFDAASDTKNETSLDGMENAPDMAAREHATDEGELTISKSEEGAGDKNAPATVCDHSMRCHTWPSANIHRLCAETS